MHDPDTNPLNTVNWSEIFNNNQNLHEMTNECINTITQIIEDETIG